MARWSRRERERGDTDSRSGAKATSGGDDDELMKKNTTSCGETPLYVDSPKLELTVIKQQVQSQLQQARRTRKSVDGMTKRLNKMQLEGLNNAINSTTVAAVLIATVAFSAIFSLPGHYCHTDHDRTSAGEANIGPRIEFVAFFMFDSFALFLSLAVVVVQTSLVVTQSKSKRNLVAVINKLMWLACVMISAAFLALSYIVVGHHDTALAVAVTFIGMAATLGTICCWLVFNRLQSSTTRATPSRSLSPLSHSDILNTHRYSTVYAI